MQSFLWGWFPSQPQKHQVMETGKSGYVCIATVVPREANCKHCLSQSHPPPCQMHTLLSLSSRSQATSKNYFFFITSVQKSSVVSLEHQPYISPYSWVFSISFCFFWVSVTPVTSLLSHCDHKCTCPTWWYLFWTLRVLGTCIAHW